MEQVIKFRGKSIDNNDFVYGYYHQDPEDGHFITDFEYVNVPAGFDEPPSGFFKKVSLEVTPESVGQFTGLLDKHGKEIYCGDILKGVSYNTFSKGQSDNYEVIWGVDGWHIKGTYFSIQELRNYCNNDIEIIGNIHQNNK